MTLQNAIIRHAVPDDIRQMVNLLNELFAIETDFTFNSKKQYNGLKMILSRPGSIVLVAEVEKVIVGMCTVQTVISTAEGNLSGLLEDMVVTGKYRGQGIGTRLLNAAETWAADNNISRIQLLADSRNAPALEFYRSHSWQQTNMVCLRRKNAED